MMKDYIAEIKKELEEQPPKTKYEPLCCPFCGRELWGWYGHADGIGCCANFYHCECGKYLEVKHDFKTDTDEIIEAPEMWR